MSAIAYRSADIGRKKIFSREAGPEDAPALLLHGFLARALTGSAAA